MSIPARIRPTPPTSFREKDSFYDPHGAPPFVGVEHDEDDGYRINWNLGSEYDNNQYGKPVGDGKTPRARAAAAGAARAFSPPTIATTIDAARLGLLSASRRNESLNPTVYLRCVGKRWRQENRGRTRTSSCRSSANHFVFRT